MSRSHVRDELGICIKCDRCSESQCCDQDERCPEDRWINSRDARGNELAARVLPSGNLLIGPAWMLGESSDD